MFFFLNLVSQQTAKRVPDSVLVNVNMLKNVLHVRLEFLEYLLRQTPIVVEIVDVFYEVLGDFFEHCLHDIVHVLRLKQRLQDFNRVVVGELWKHICLEA